MENEILDVEITLQDGKTQKMSIKEVYSFDWSKIPKGKRGIIELINGNLMVVTINSADLDGICFTIDGGRHTYHYEENVIAVLYIEVEPIDVKN